MFRLAINVSVTRLILTSGDAGSVVKAFGEFVVGGNVVVGLVIFLILVVIQFVVVTNGAGRVAEVGARFTLDAMPGKQMAIDADLNAGLISDDQARARRSEIAQRGRLLRRHGRRLEVRQRRRHGGRHHHRDQPRRRHHRRHAPAPPGLLRSHPPVLAADRRRRPRRADPRAVDLRRHRHHRHARRLRPRPRLGHRQPDPQPAQGAARRRRRDRAVRADPGSAEAAVPASSRRSSARSAGPCATGCPSAIDAQDAARAAAAKAALPKAADEPISEVGVDALELAIGFGLVPLVDGGSDPARPSSSLLRRVSQIRRQIAGELGLVIPPVRIHDELGMESHEYVFKVRGSEVTRGRIMPGHLLAMDPGDASGTLAGIPTREPAFGLEAVWVARVRARRGRGAGLHRRRPRVGDRHPSHRDDPRPRRRGAHAPGRARAARQAQGDQRGRRRRGRARRAVARRDPARAAVAAHRGRADPRSRHDRGGNRRQGANNT